MAIAMRWRSIRSCVSPNRPRGSSIVVSVVVALMMGSAGVDAQSGPITSADFSYLGAFRLECADDWCSYNLDGVGLAADGSLWVTDHVYDYAVRRVESPGGAVGVADLR